MKFLTISILVAAVFCNILCAAEKMIFYTEISSEGHIQGHISDGKVIFRVFDRGIIKSDMNGKTLKKAAGKLIEGKKWIHAGSPVWLTEKFMFPAISADSTVF